MKLNLHLTFNGQCEEAFRFYASCLGGTIQMMLKYGDSPMSKGTPADWSDKIVHASLSVKGSVLAGADAMPADYKAPQGFYALLDLDDPAEAERIFHALSEGGNVQMPLQVTFWAERFGVVTDRFGIPWEINCARG